MRKPRYLFHIHIRLIYFTFVYTQLNAFMLISATYPSTTTTTTTITTTIPSTTDTNTQLNTNTNLNDTPTSDEELTPEMIKTKREQLKDIAKEVVFDLKGKPTLSKTPEKAFVPRAMLEEYMKLREDMRDVVPDDRDFYGKIDIDGYEDSTEDFWSAVYNKYGSYDLRVDMGPTDPTRTNYHYRGKASHIANVGPSDIKVVPPNIEPILQPHARTIQQQKQFQSVHLTFDLSQEVYQSALAAEDLKGAELYLSRSRLYNCLFHECSSKKPIPFFNNDAASERQDVDADETTRLPVPKYQRVYILQIYGYDQFSEPRTRLHESKRIKTDESSPIVFDIRPIVMSWLMNPKSNYGIIVRVTNDDEDYDKAIRNEYALRKRKLVRSVHSASTNVSEIESETTDQLITPPKQVFYQIPEHVRLKREFRSKSDSEDVWLRVRPNIMLYSEAARKHVKRHHVHDSQFDESTSTSTMSSASANQQQSPTTQTSVHSSTTLDSLTTSDSPRLESTTHVSSAWNRRGHVPKAPRRNSPRPQQHGSQQRSKPKSRRCSKQLMYLNFDEVGWSNWIIAPVGYYANYCSGECNYPLTDIQNATNHAIIQALYHRAAHPAVPKSCCAPVKLGSMAVLYQLDGVVQMRLYDDMIVDACGCL